MLRVTGPVTSRTSACLGLATRWMPKRSRSYRGFVVAAISNSHALQLPASTWRTWSDRPRRPRMRSLRRAADSDRLSPGRTSTFETLLRPVAGSTSKDAVCASCSRVYAATSTSLATLIACSGHPATHSRHWMHAAYESESVFTPEARVAVAIAPVGHDRAHSSHAVHRVKSMTGNPNAGCAPNGLASVSDPVFRLFVMMLNMSTRPTF